MAYRVKYRFIHAWDNREMGHVAGWFPVEVREYTDGTQMVFAGEARYVKDEPDKGFAHSVFMGAERELCAGRQRI